MDELKRDLAVTREGMMRVREELAKRPTRRQFNTTIVLAILAIIVVSVAAIAAVQSASSSDDAKDAAVSARGTTELVQRGFLISSCRTDINAALVGRASLDLDVAREERASAIQKRDNLTMVALEALAAEDVALFNSATSQAPAARAAVSKADLVVSDRVEALRAGRREYDLALNRSIKDPEAFAEECAQRSGS